MTDDTPSDDELEESYSDEPQYTVDLNGKRYSLNKEARKSIQNRAANEYEANKRFSCFWKQASPEQYSDGEWEENIHDKGDPVLVIETEGVMVPWEKLDKLNVEMEDAEPFADMDSGSDEAEKVIGRTHFEQDPEQYEGVESPDGEEEDKIPQAPKEMPDHPMMIQWIPDHPDINHEWAAGEALTPTISWVEWNVQKYADQPRMKEDGDGDGHNHWESLLKGYGCEVVSELSVSQDVPRSQDSTSDKEQVEDVGPKYGGDNWAV